MVNEAARNMSGDENCEGWDPTFDTTGFDLSHSLSIKVEYYRSFEYTLNWTMPMSLRRSSRLKSTQKSPASNKDVGQPHIRSQRGRGRSRLKKTDPYESEECDIIDLINRNPVDKQEAALEAVGILDYGLDKSNDESGSDSSSIVSGPSNLCYDLRDELYHNVCSACHKLYEKAKRLKTPIKSKLLDNDPESLTCDQWVLMKKWKPRGPTDAKRKLLIHVQLDDGIAVRRGEQSSPCSRPHVFLQRNLRQAKLLAEMKKKKRRRRGNSQGSRVAKQQRLQNNRPQQHTNIKGLLDNSNSCFSSCSNLRDRRSPEMESRAKKDVTVELVPSSVALKATASAEVRAQKRPPKKTSEFRDLLAQLRGNSSMVIRETY